MEQLLDRIAKASPALKIGVFAAVCAVVTAMNYFFLISDVESEISHQEITQSQLDSQLAEKQAIAQNLNDRRREMDRLEQQLAEALTQLPESKDIDELLSQFNDLAKKSGIEITRVEPGPESPSGFFARIPVKLAVSGNYHEVAVFLQDISNMRRIVNVNNIHLASPTLKNEKVILKSDFLATTFRFLESNPKPGNNSGGTPQ